MAINFDYRKGDLRKQEFKNIKYQYFMKIYNYKRLKDRKNDA